MDTLEELFEGLLRNVLYAERQVAKVLPKMARKATAEPLAEALQAHHEQTQHQIKHLGRGLN